MIRYLVFGFSHYYPGGGMNDIKLKATKLKEVKEYVKDWATVVKGSSYENIHVFDLIENKVIYEAEFDVHDYMDKNARDLNIKINFD